VVADQNPPFFCWYPTEAATSAMPPKKTPDHSVITVPLLKGGENAGWECWDTHTQHTAHRKHETQTRGHTYIHDRVREDRRHLCSARSSAFFAASKEMQR